MSEQGYLDGIPLKLSAKFYPRSRPQFNEIDIHIPLDALQEDYDFSLEKSVIAQWEQHKLKQEEDDQRRATEKTERLRIEEEKEKLRLEEEEINRLRLEEEAKERLRIEEEVKVKERLRVEEGLQLRINNLIKLNYSDFESDTANPFDNLELKSINDMEVLASVLKNSSINTTPYNFVIHHNNFSSSPTTTTGLSSPSTSYYSSASVPHQNYQPPPQQQQPQ